MHWQRHVGQFAGNPATHSAEKARCASHAGSLKSEEDISLA